ncbi:hypothetical protein GCM10023093_09730 [Nemorincola caseinilytica]|uniref:Secretion system C-terminal sorting domain-containing protein n=1 Tax=Nemorincola caseinilytica TaxID=2054315 RepID=A0ABP8NAD5_9BACT
MRALLSIAAIALCSAAHAQFAPQAGVAGSTAIPSSSPLFAGWATSCTVQRGYIDIADPPAGLTSLGDPANATGMSNSSIVSLGDSGVATLTFSGHLYNGSGPDFAVFENGFADPADPSMAFLELAFVEVSSDGVTFFRFPATSNTPVSPQVPGSGVYMDASKVHNLAGKYISGYGTPFDLQDLAGTPGLDVNNITHIRLVDVVGSVSGHSSTDKEGQVINDPYPTNFPSGGFDLDAVGAIHLISTGIDIAGPALQAAIFPNPATDKVNIRIAHAMGNTRLTLTSTTGAVLLQAPITGTTAELSIAKYPAGIYYLSISDDNGNTWTGKLARY